MFYYTEFYVLFFALYQFKAFNDLKENKGVNLGLAIIIFLLYLIFNIVLLVLGSYTRHRIQKLPRRFQFLTYEPSKFPM